MCRNLTSNVLFSNRANTAVTNLDNIVNIARFASIAKSANIYSIMNISSLVNIVKITDFVKFQSKQYFLHLYRVGRSIVD